MDDVQISKMAMRWQTEDHTDRSKGIEYVMGTSRRPGARLKILAFIYHLINYIAWEDLSLNKYLSSDLIQGVLGLYQS